MFKIKIHLDKSKIHNIGVFASQPVLKGDVVYIHNPELDITLTDEELNKLDDEDIRVFKNYGFKDKVKGLWKLSFDDVRFINHSSEPNIYARDNEIVALHDIKEGDELLQDYNDFEELREELR